MAKVHGKGALQRCMSKVYIYSKAKSPTPLSYTFAKHLCQTPFAKGVRLRSMTKVYCTGIAKVSLIHLCNTPLSNTFCKRCMSWSMAKVYCKGIAKINLKGV